MSKMKAIVTRPHQQTGISQILKEYLRLPQTVDAGEYRCQPRQFGGSPREPVIKRLMRQFGKPVTVHGMGQPAQQGSLFRHWKHVLRVVARERLIHKDVVEARTVDFATGEFFGLELADGLANEAQQDRAFRQLAEIVGLVDQLQCPPRVVRRRCSLR